MKIQNVLFPRAGVCDQEAMYFRPNKYVFLTNNHKSLTFEKHGVVQFDTYFNGISIEKWDKYTNVGEISLELRFKGKFEVQLRSKEKIHGVIAEKELSVTTVESDEVTSAVLPFRSYEKKGMYFFKLEALEDDSEFWGGGYHAEISDEKLYPVDIAINICTFRREPFVKRNLEILRNHILENPENELNGHLNVFISDNGKTLDIPALSGNGVHIVPNKNVGGAGGFTRGLIEILECKDYTATHALFMDDDIVIEPEALFRTYTMLRCRKEKYEDTFIGGAMLRLDQPNIQVEAGAAWNAGNLQSRKSGLNLNDVDACLYNEVEEYVEFNAWWYCCVPMTVVREDNLPMPIFIRGDDLEYGLRNMKSLILMNGICVWHEPFENKYSSFLDYYILRNLLYDNALHFPNYSKWAFIKRLYGKVLHELFYYRYKNVDLVFRGVEDFFKGVPFLKETDGEQLHQEIMAAGYKGKSLDELPMPFSYADYKDSFFVQDSKLHKTLRMITLNGLLLPANHDSTTSMALCRPINFYRANRVLQYDVSGRTAFVTEKSIGKTFRALGRLLKMSWKIVFKFDDTMSKFKNEEKQLWTMESWENYLGLK